MSCGCGPEQEKNCETCQMRNATLEQYREFLGVMAVCALQEQWEAVREMANHVEIEMVDGRPKGMLYSAR